MKMKLIAARKLLVVCFAISWLLLPVAVRGTEPNAAAKVPVIIDTDIGSDIDDALALALALTSPEIDVRGVTTVGSEAEARAWMVCRLLTAVGRREIPVAWGRDPQPAEPIEGQIQYRRHPAVIFHRTSRPVPESAVEFLYAQLKARPGRKTLVALGPLTNVARLLTDHPDCKPWIPRIVLMGGALRVGYEGKPPALAEWNIKTDIPAARTVFTAGIPLVVAPLDATASLKLEEPLRRRLFAACTPLTLQVQALYQLWDHPTPVLFDPVAVALSFSERFCKLENLALEVDERGFTCVGTGKANARVATSIQTQAFLEWYVEHVAAGKAVLPAAPANRSTLVPRGGMPNRVHCFEDFETDIEKRWWMSGKLERAEGASPLARRACRAVLTQDFDDLMGDTKTMYQAVIFNPVPGPPMGKNPRLGFRYLLKGTDTLRVQIYSLSKGYHRYLSLAGLPQGTWQAATVDMTAARRPDGSGGRLAENERIDDVQFYADPRAELLIDDIVLYDAAVPGERRPFPRRLLFTGWFDTGKQGQEWPGSFAIVDKGFFWKAARAVPNRELGIPWIRLHLRGQRTVGATTHLFFRYHLAGTDTLRVLLVNRSAGTSHVVALKDLPADRWAEATVDFSRDSLRADGRPGGPQAGDRVDEIQFLLPQAAELLVDDVLLYEPAG
jgi:inosine-uridine nucleoside N-ribohydrolase